MFAHFERQHGNTLVDALHGKPVEPPMVDAAVAALYRCRTDIVGQLKEITNPQLRRELRIIYEGLTISADLIVQNHLPDRSGF